MAQTAHHRSPKVSCPLRGLASRGLYDVHFGHSLYDVHFLQKIDSALPCPSLSTHALAPSRALAGPLRLAWQLVTYLLTTYSLTHLQLGDRPCRSKTFNATLGVASRSRSTPSRSPRHSSSRKINQTFNGASFLASSASRAVVALSSLAEDGTPSAVELALLTSSGRREISRCKPYHPPHFQSCCCRTRSADEIDAYRW